jgi:hypothetical protein
MHRPSFCRQEVVQEIDTWLDKGFQGFESLWDAEAGIYKCRDQITGKLCPAAISAGFLPLFAGRFLASLPDVR